MQSIIDENIIQSSISQAWVVSVQKGGRKTFNKSKSKSKVVELAFPVLFIISKLIYW